MNQDGSFVLNTTGLIRIDLKRSLQNAAVTAVLRKMQNRLTEQCRSTGFLFFRASKSVDGADQFLGVVESPATGVCLRPF